jgi:uncharacterized protein (DUF2225 family)
MNSESNGMANLKPVYNSKITCPVCDKNIEVTKVRSKSIRLIAQDEDFCPYYEECNPIYYEAWICSFCGYAAHNSVFEDASFMDRKLVNEKITPKWSSRSFTGERDIEQALDAFKIVLYNLVIRQAPSFEFARVCLRIAWLYRYKGNADEEKRFLRYAYDYYQKAYSNEPLGGGKMDEYSCIYIIGELARRLGEPEEALSWFGRIISAAGQPEKKQKILPRLLENTREQIQMVRQAMQTGKRSV